MLGFYVMSFCLSPVKFLKSFAMRQHLAASGGRGLLASSPMHFLLKFSAVNKTQISATTYCVVRARGYTVSERFACETDRRTV